MQTWHLLQVLRQERLQCRVKLSSLDRSVRCWSSTITKKQDETAEIADDNVSSSSERPYKLKGKQRWRARQRQLRAEAATAEEESGSSIENEEKERKAIPPAGSPAGQNLDNHVTDLRSSDSLEESLYHDLPKPSYLRPTLQDILRKKLHQKHAPPPRTKGSTSNPGGRKLKDSLKAAPFQTVFAQNPYAHILASPVREDALSRGHLPMNCLLDFHIAELDPEPQVASKNKTKAGKEKTAQYQLLPLSLATELAPARQKIRPSDSKGDGAREDVSASRDDSPRPTGNASYLTASYDAVKFITDDTRRRLIPFALSRRMHFDNQQREMHLAQVKWRPDMPKFILGALRSIVAKKLGYLLRSKGARDRPGLLHEVLGGGQDLRRLHQMEDVSCVVKLTADSEDESEHSATHAPSTSGTIQHAWRDYPFLDAIKPLPSSQSYAEESLSSVRVVPYRSINIPIYSLHTLLGSRLANKVVAETIFAEGGKNDTDVEPGELDGQAKRLRPATRYVVLARSNGTLQAQMWLSKLQCFVGSSTISD